MANDYFDSGDYTALPRLALARAEAVNGIIAAIVSGFDKLPSEAELKQDRVTYAVTTGSANAYEVDLPYRPSSYTAGMTIKIKVHAANAAGACTINLMGAGGALLGAVAVKTINGDDPAANDLPLNGVVTLIHNGTHFRLAGAAAGAVASAAASASAAATSANNAAQSEANALSHYNSFRGVYYGTLPADPSVDPLGNPVGEGDWYWNTTTKRARIYNGSDFEDIGIAQLSQYVFTAEGGETSISGVDDNGNTLSYTVGFVWVFKNGVRLVPGDDYTATDGTSIDDLTALSPGDVIAVDAFSPFSLANCLDKTKNLADLPDKTMARNNLQLGALATKNTIGTSELVNNSVTLAKMEHGTQGDILIYGASGAPTRLAAGTAGQVLHSNGAGADPSWGGLPPPDYDSGEQVVTANSLLTLAHGLGAKPTLTKLYLRLKAAQANWSIDDDIEIANGNHNGNNEHGYTLGSNATNIYVATGAAIRIINKANGAGTVLTLADCRYIVRAWK